LPPRTKAVIMNYSSGSLLFYLRLEEIFGKISHDCINPRKKAPVLKSKKVIFKVPNLVHLSLIKKKSKGHKNVCVEIRAGAGAEAVIPINSSTEP
jgi:protein subunit release factor A